MIGKQLGISLCKKVVKAIDHQLSKQTSKNVSKETKELMWKVIIVNSGCESHFTDLDWCAAKHGGSIPISTVSDLQVVSYNRYLWSKEMNDTSHIVVQYKWARSSKEVKKKKKFFEAILLGNFFSVYRTRFIWKGASQQSKENKRYSYDRRDHMIPKVQA